MRFTTIQKLVLIALITLSASSFADELLLNGGFESGSTGWSVSYAPGPEFHDSGFGGAARTGSKGFYGYDNNSPGLTLSQSVALESTTKTLSFLLKTIYGSGVTYIDDLSVTKVGSAYRVTGYTKTSDDLVPSINTLHLTFGDKPSVALTLASSFALFSYDYIFGPSTNDTQSSLTTLSKSLRSSFNATVMSSNYANMNTYDCNLFDKNNMCISAGGRITTIDNPSSHHSAAVVVLGHKISPHIRIGGFLDQSVNHNMPSGVDMSNKNPMAGAFAIWNHQADGLGLQMKLANAYLDKDVTTSRAVVGTSEAGRGRTDLNTQSYVGELSYAFNYLDSTIVRPYFALRYTRIKQDGYTEDTTASVTAPLTYAKLSDRSTTALMGVKLNHALTPRTNLTASLGLEQDFHHKTDQLTASGVADLTSENFNNNIKRTRPVASAGAYYAVAKNQRLSGEVYYQQLPFQSTGSATAYFNYMIGF
jgi:hypothetical protein